MKKITKKENAQFIKSCKEIIENLAGNKVDDSNLYSGEHYLFENEVFGKLAIKIDDDNSSCYSIYAKFEDEKTASNHFKCNPFTGKYNLHTYYNDEPKIVEEKLIYQFNNISLEKD